MIEIFSIPQDFTLSEYLNATFYITARMKVFKRLFLFLRLVSLLSAVIDIAAQKLTTSVFIFAMLKLFLLPGF